MIQRSAWLLLVSQVILAGCSTQPPAVTRKASSADAPTPTQPFDRIDRPVTVPAARATLADEDLVVGVVVGGKARAYRLAAFNSISKNVVNDVVNKIAVTITYCNHNECVRAYTDNREEPLPIGVGGFNHGLLLRVGDDVFQQKTSKGMEGVEIPYKSMPFELTQWGEWKKAHPDTDVYVGRTAPPASPDDW
jgi:hypothetical protein